VRKKQKFPLIINYNAERFSAIKFLSFLMLLRRYRSHNPRRIESSLLINDFLVCFTRRSGAFAGTQNKDGEKIAPSHRAGVDFPRQGLNRD
jgi:hypothetical protein